MNPINHIILTKNTIEEKNQCRYWAAYYHGALKKQKKNRGIILIIHLKSLGISPYHMESWFNVARASLISILNFYNVLQYITSWLVGLKMCSTQNSGVSNEALLVTLQILAHWAFIEMKNHLIDK